MASMSGFAGFRKTRRISFERSRSVRYLTPRRVVISRKTRHFIWVKGASCDAIHAMSDEVGWGWTRGLFVAASGRAPPEHAITAISAD